MLEVKFYLKSVTPNKKGQQPVIAQVGYNYKKIRKPIFKCKPNEWDKKKQKLSLPEVNNSKYEEFHKINELIDLLRNSIRELDNKAISEKRNVSETEIRHILNLDVNRKENIEINFFDIFDEYIEIQKASKAANTVRGIKTIRNYLEIFQKKTKYFMTFDSIDVAFADALMTYSFSKMKIDNDYFVKIANVLKRFMEWSSKRGLYDLNRFPKEELLSIREKENDVVFLTMEELKILDNWDFKLDRLSQARDLFCFACYTGFRHSDAHSLLPEHIKEAMISKLNIKTQRFTKVPLNKHAQRILDHYIGMPFPLKQISNQKANDYIKECCKEIAESHNKGDLFKRSVLKLKVSGRKVTEEVKPLHDAITFHVARKTFITNSLMLGVNLQALQEMGAPKNQRDLKKYLKISDAFKSKVMSETWDRVE